MEKSSDIFALAPQQQRVSYRTHLQKLATLGPWFHAADALRLTGFSSATLKQSLWYWSKNKLIEPLGGRSGLYYNSTFFALADKNIRQALAMVTPSSVDASLSILTRHGLWTQHSHTIRLINKPNDLAYKIENVDFEIRKANWFMRLRENGAIKIDGYMFSLTPAAVLADVLLYDPDLAPDPDDLDFEGFEKKDILRFFRLMNLPDENVNAKDFERSYTIAIHNHLRKKEIAVTKDFHLSPG